MVVRASAKEIAFGQSSRSFLQAGIEKLADAVGVTLGPRGTFVSALSPLQELEKKAMPVKGRGDIKGKLMILTSIEKRNKNLSSCSNTRLPLLCYIILQLSPGYISPQFVANIEKLILEFENAKISVTDQKISTIKEIIPFLEKMTQLGALLLIIAEDVTGRGLATPAVNKLAEHSQWLNSRAKILASRSRIDRGGGAAYVHLSATLPIVKEKLEDHDELLGADIEQKALVAPAALVARNAETEGEDQGQRIGAIEPAKVTRCALQNAVHQQLEWSLQHGRMWRRSPRKKSPPPPLMMMMMAWFSHLNE
ncbi:RuBisCO large subunit-binding protein subunit alpha [Musa troglodytarum]|uniref:RuBisCO large subunit-binding protein subunit alpha n=1 Tax=Musa troglodytarum TaxID=320322 RepID=A0A9E7KWV7_9LILI|nr:RuBisCO large subunit-binding protein subunit alpha [Musa troglodytarum]